MSDAFSALEALRNVLYKFKTYLFTYLRPMYRQLTSTRFRCSWNVTSHSTYAVHKYIPDELLWGVRETGLNTAHPRADDLPEDPRLLMW